MFAIIQFRILEPHSSLSRNINIEIYKFVMFPVVLYGFCTWSCLSIRVFEKAKYSILELRKVNKQETENIS
jgi:hypothetical protein